jgi:predicted enzyme related to lactoylglutathione lyase
MLEFGLYVQDVSRAADFYHQLFGFPVLVSQERIAALDVEGLRVCCCSGTGHQASP